MSRIPVSESGIVYTPWNLTCIKDPTKIVEIDSEQDDPGRYAQRYLSTGGYLPKDFRYQIEIYQEFLPGSSVILLGAGHADRSNFLIKENENVSQVIAVDYTIESAHGLDSRVDFIHANIVSDKLSVVGDYVFSSHTLEHFSRSEVLDCIIPKCLDIAKRAVVVVVPYGDNWGDEPSHKCRFYENDELCALSTKWKRIHNGQELVLMFEVK